MSTDSTNDTISANVSRSNEEPDSMLEIAVSLAPAKVSNESIEASASPASAAAKASNESIERLIAVTSPLVAKISAAKSDEIAPAKVSNESIDESASPDTASVATKVSNESIETSVSPS